jgi:hypothetical protein
MARCPAHDDGTPSLAIREGRDGRILLKCHAGCTQWDVIGVLKARGIWAPAGRPGLGHGDGRGRDRDGDEGRDRTGFAMKIWQESAAATRSLVAAYLRSRGLIVAPPESLRFHPALKHPSGGAWPVMVGLVTRGVDGAPIGIHRTFLNRDGSGKAPVIPQKMMLGRCRGGVVRLGPADNAIMVGEGIETCLAAMQATGRPAWAALSTSGIRSLDLPQTITEVILLADGDDPGEAAARHAAHRWSREGRSVRIARPPAGLDFNDVLAGGLATRPATRAGASS